MANVNLKWESVEFAAADVSGWNAFKRAVDVTQYPNLLSDRAVYVIRICRPFAFSYDKGHSPVAYIGKGQAQARITSHLKSWIPHLSKTIPGLRIKIYFCEPKVPRSGTICEGVEADLIQRFLDRYGERPLRNRNTPTKAGARVYAQSQLHILHPGKGSRFQWAIRPLPASHFYRA
ncbi:hypothetical protein D3C72_683150 [compost metagenome]|jgi:hypothetical protein